MIRNSLDELLRKIFLTHVVVRESPNANNNKTLIRLHLIPLSNSNMHFPDIASNMNSVLYPQTIVKQKRNQHVSHLPTYHKITQDVLDDILDISFSSTSSSKRLTNNTCIICCSKFVKGEYYRTLPICNHAYHKKCIDKWFTSDKENMKCPICRTSHTKENVKKFNEEFNINAANRTNGNTPSNITNSIENLESSG